MYKTNQEVFDKVTSHLLTQKRKAMTDGKCSYRGEDNLMCAIGALIPDEVYTDTFEGNGIGGIKRVLIEKEVISPSVSFVFLQGLQNIHDAYEVETWPQRLIDLALTYHLSDAEILKHV